MAGLIFLISMEPAEVLIPDFHSHDVETLYCFVSLLSQFITVQLVVIVKLLLVLPLSQSFTRRDVRQFIFI